jgi:hypothetical protein
VDFLHFFGGFALSIGVLPSDLGILGVLVRFPPGFGIAMRHGWSTLPVQPWLTRAFLSFFLVLQTTWSFPDAGACLPCRLLLSSFLPCSNFNLPVVICHNYWIRREMPTGKSLPAVDFPPALGLLKLSAPCFWPVPCWERSAFVKEHLCGFCLCF